MSIGLSSSAYNFLLIAHAVAESNHLHWHNFISRNLFSADSDSIDQSNLFFSQISDFPELPTKKFSSTSTHDSD